MKSILTLALLLAISPAHAVSEWGAKNATFVLGTKSNGTESFYVGTGNNRALAGSVLVSVVVSSPSASGGAMFEVWDSSTVALATTGRTKLADVLCTSLGTYPFWVEVQYGLTIVSKGCVATLLYLTHK